MCGDRGLGEDERRAQVVLDGAVECLQRHVLDHRVVGETSVVDQDVDAARAVQHRVDQAVARRGVFQVGGDTERGAAGLLDQRDGLVDGAGQR